MTANGYLNELINYGGIATPRHEAIQDMRRNGSSQVCIDRWLQGYERSGAKIENAIQMSKTQRQKLFAA